jgi:RecA-family ATPase
MHEFAPVSWVVPQLIPEGLTLLAGKPKIGKSWMALDLAIGIAGNGFIFGGIRAVQGDVLYCALEDNWRRLQKRTGKILGEDDWPDRLRLHTSWRRLDKGGIDDLAEWVDGASAARLIILDTLAGVRPIRTKDGYSEDYAALEELHRVANDRGIGILVLHHTRKMEAEDPIDTVSGTLGLAGCADSILVLNRTQQSGVTLYGRGRDIEEFERAAEFSKETCRWRLKGNAEEAKRANTEERVLEVMARSSIAMTPKEIVAATGLKEAAVSTALWRLLGDGLVVRPKRGEYSLPGENQKTPQEL